MLKSPDLAKPTGVITGKCTGPDSKPVANASVTLYDVDKNVMDSVVSGPDGSYTFKAMPMGNYHITAILANPDGTQLQGDVDIILTQATQTVDIPMVYLKAYLIDLLKFA